jgi:hypothetical protein
MTMEQRVSALEATPGASIMTTGLTSIELRIQALEAAKTNNLGVSDHHRSVCY